MCSAAKTRPGHRVLQDVEKAQLYLQTAPGKELFMFLKWRRTVCTVLTYNGNIDDESEVFTCKYSKVLGSAPWGAEPRFELGPALQ